MATFPLREADVIVLAEEMIAGFTDNPLVYPAPPVAVLDLTAAKTAVTTAMTAATAARAAAEAAVDAKGTALEALESAMKTDIRYAENTVDFDDVKLKLIGWGAKKASTSLTAPGQTLELTVPVQGDGSVSLAWKAPIDGGAPQAYKVMRRERPAGAWEDVHTAVIAEAQLTDQPKAIELEYQIIAVNKAGEGQPSNTQMVVL
jgi:multidrug efflux pump subunit AcrA (membrane-fusion protein)